MASNYQQNYVSPETQIITQPRRDHGLWDTLARAIRSTVPERENVDADGEVIASQPYQKAGFFRSLLGDRSNELNLAAGAGARDLSTARGLAEAQEGADVRGDERDVANKRGLMGFGNELGMKRDEFQGGIDRKNATWRSALGLNTESELLGRRHELGQRADEAEFDRRKQLQGLHAQDALDLAKTNFGYEKDLRGTPQLVDPARAPKPKPTIAEQMRELESLGNTSNAQPSTISADEPDIIPIDGAAPKREFSNGYNLPQVGTFNGALPIVDMIMKKLSTQRTNAPVLNAK